MSWAQLLALRYAVRKENWRPNVLAINEMQLHQLLNDDKFVKSVYLPSSQTDIEQGSIGTVLGMKVQVCNEITNGIAYAIDTRIASVMLLRRDLTVEDWYDAKTGKSGIRGIYSLWPWCSTFHRNCKNDQHQNNFNLSMVFLMTANSLVDCCGQMFQMWSRIPFKA